MKKIFGIALVSVAFLTSCDKELEQPADWSSINVIHASPVSVNPGADTLHVFVDGSRYNAAGILYTASSGYLPVIAGSHSFDIRRGNLTTSTTSDPAYVNTFNYSTVRGGIYTFVVYDTSTSSTANDAKVLTLKDELVPSSTNSYVRFLHLAPKGQAVDVTFLRTGVTPADSVTITNKSFIGPNPDKEALAAFSTALPRGNYTIKVKAAGTQTVLLQATIDLRNGTDVTMGRIYTIYITGTAKGRPLAIGAFRHY